MPRRHFEIEISSVKRKPAQIFAVGLFECLDRGDEALEGVFSRASAREVHRIRNFQPNFFERLPRLKHELEASFVGMRERRRGFRQLFYSLTGFRAVVW